jgi:hypothetical protein
MSFNPFEDRFHKQWSRAAAMNEERLFTWEHPVGALVIDLELFPRHLLSEQLITQCSKRWERGASVPAVDVFYDARDQLVRVARGVEWVLSAQRIGRERILCRVFRGGQREMLSYVRRAMIHQGERWTGEETNGRAVERRG